MDTPFTRYWCAPIGLALVVMGLATAPAALASCAAPANAIVAENCQPGTPPQIWDVPGAGSENIQGFATDISVDQGQVVRFKIKSDAAYRIDIYRAGWYQGLGARKVDTLQGLGPSSQSGCGFAPDSGLIDCGNWTVSASWSVPASATSGIYFAHLVQEAGTQGESHVPFVVRDDGGRSDLLFQTSDTTWQAYNDYGGKSLYAPAQNTRAYKVSYNRPFVTRAVDSGEDWLFNSEYPMVRFLERNGYDVSYFTGVDSDRRGAEIRNHRAFLSIGHDEYWSGTQRANVEAARDAGVSLAFFSGNEVFWKTRWENDHRTLVTYKETHESSRIDPTGIWTGTWRDARNPDGARPENALTGTIFSVNAGTSAIQVPAEDGNLRFWRSTGVSEKAPGTSTTLTAATLGYEWDEDFDNGSRPAGLVRLSGTTVSGVQKLDVGDPGSSLVNDATATHHLTLYRDTNGLGLDALVFGAGTVQWSWGLDGAHDRGSDPPSPAMQQATANLFADMSVQPATPAEVQLATCSTDRTAPSASVAPLAVTAGSAATIHGTAADSGGGRVGGVEVSVDGGSTWHPATGRESWDYTWSPTASGTVTPLARAADDSGNLTGSGPFTSPECVGATIPGGGTPPGGTPPSGGVGGTHGSGSRRIRVKISRRSVRASRKGVVRLRVSCPSGRACRVHLRLRLKRHTIAARTRTVPGGKTRSLELKLTGAARRTLLRKRVLRVTAIASVAHGKTTSVTIRLRAPRDATQRH